MNKRGGSREGAGRKSGPATATHPVRCTDEGWKWLQSQATGKGHTSVGKWADAKGRRASKRKGNSALSQGGPATHNTKPEPEPPLAPANG